MEDLFAAGGIGAVLRELQPLLHLDCLTVAGETLGERLAGAGRAPVDREVVRPLAEPLQPVGGLVALFGSLAPKGAIFKRSAADPKLFEKEGRAVVFTSLEDLSARIDDPGLDVTPDDFLVLQNAGPLSALGHARGRLSADPAEARARRGQGHGAHLRRADERHRLRLDRPARDARTRHPAARSPRCATATASACRSRSAASTCWSRPTNWRAARPPPPPMPERGYARLYRREILQADRGCDFDFLRKHPLTHDRRVG